jgi:hypothetical protein
LLEKLKYGMTVPSEAFWRRNGEKDRRATSLLLRDGETESSFSWSWFSEDGGSAPNTALLRKIVCTLSCTYKTRALHEKIFCYRTG